MFRQTYNTETFRIKSMQIMGIINLSPESPVKHSIINEQEIIQKAEEMLQDGAEIVEIGGNSSSSKAQDISEKEEEKRVIPVLRLLVETGFKVSVDTWRARIARLAIKHGAWMINDINWGRDEEMLKTVAKSDVKYCIMHMRGKPKKHYQVDQSFKNPIDEIKSDLEKVATRLHKLGKNKSDIYLDPGFGFGKSAKTNMQILKGLTHFKEHPIMISASRKAFLTYLFKTEDHSQDNPDLYEATIAFNTLAMLAEPDIIRVHDVRAIAIAKDIVSNFLLE